MSNYRHTLQFRLESPSISRFESRNSIILLVVRSELSSLKHGIYFVIRASSVLPSNCAPSHSKARFSLNRICVALLQHLGMPHQKPYSWLVMDLHALSILSPLPSGAGSEHCFLSSELSIVMFDEQEIMIRIFRHFIILSGDGAGIGAFPFIHVYFLWNLLG